MLKHADGCKIVSEKQFVYKEPLEAVRPKDRHKRFAGIGLFFVEARFPHIL